MRRGGQELALHAVELGLAGDVAQVERAPLRGRRVTLDDAHGARDGPRGIREPQHVPLGLGEIEELRRTLARRTPAGDQRVEVAGIEWREVFGPPADDPLEGGIAVGEPPLRGEGDDAVGNDAEHRVQLPGQLLEAPLVGLDRGDIDSDRGESRDRAVCVQDGLYVQRDPDDAAILALEAELAAEGPAGFHRRPAPVDCFHVRQRASDDVAQQSPAQVLQ